MSAFHFPQPGERANAVAVSVPIHTLRALLAAALAWEIDTNTALPGILPPQIGDATNETLSQFSDDDVRTVYRMAVILMQDRADAETPR